MGPNKLNYVAAMKAYLIAHDRAPPATYAPHCDRSKSDFARRVLACCQAAGVAWC